MESNLFIDIHSHKKENSGIKIFNSNLNKPYSTEDNIFYSVGLHPWDIEKELFDKNNLISTLESLLKNKKVISIGEIGLDKSINIDLELQKEFLEMQLSVANKYQLPIIIHCVKSYSEFLQILKYNKYKFVFHAFNSNIDIANKLISKGCYLSFGHQLIENKKLQELIKDISLKNIFFETDESIHSIDYIYKFAADILEIDIHELKEIINKNFINCFIK